MDCPCKQDCPDRCLGCRETCTHGFQEYDAERIAKGNAKPESDTKVYFQHKAHRMKAIRLLRSHRK